MFSHLETEENIQPRRKTLYVMQNGKPECIFQVSFTKPLTRAEIQKIAEDKWSNFKIKNLRVFEVNAVELYEDDLMFVKDGSRIYLSKGDDFDSNRNFGQYQIIKDLGEGGFGTVSLAKSRITGELVAIKVTKQSKAATSKSIDMIFKESEYLRSLNHPNIVKILNCYTLKNMRFVVMMEYLEGGELRGQLRKEGKFTEEQARIYFKQIVSAISYCHRQGIVHRDIKLENILLSSDHSVKVTDFGISGVVENFNPQIDWGTLKYMPPEILSKKQRANAFAGDVWACGIILFYMVQGFLPFTGSSTAQITQRIINGEVLFSEGNDLSCNCKKLIKAMLEKDSKKRVNFFDVEIHPWLMKGHQGNIKPSMVKTVIQPPPVPQRKSVIRVKKIPKQTIPYIPCRLEKEKMVIAQQLESYKNSKKLFRSYSKGFPSLRTSEYRKTQKLTPHIQTPPFNFQQ